MKTLLIILFSICCNAAAAQNLSDKLNVLATNGLNMRSEPDTKARVVTKVAYGRSVEILERTNVSLQLGWVSDHWYKVRYRGREGFIFGGYLSKLPAPSNHEDSHLPELLQSYCLQHFSADGEAVVSTELTHDRDSLVHQLVRFTNGLELETEEEVGRKSATLILPYSVQEAYVFLEALLKTNGHSESMDQLRFIKSNDGKLTSVYSEDGSIQIKVNPTSGCYVKLVGWHAEN